MPVPAESSGSYSFEIISRNYIKYKLGNIILESISSKEVETEFLTFEDETGIVETTFSPKPTTDSVT